MRITIPASLVVLGAAFLTGTAAHAAVRLEIQYTVLEKLLSQQVFTTEGRKYVRGSDKSRCSFAYLSNPRIGGASGKLTIRTRFTGRSALDLLGKCIGLGDDFEVTIYATPYYGKGKLRFKDVQTETSGRDSLYIRSVRMGLKTALEKDFAYGLEEETRKILEEPRPGASYSQRLSDFEIAFIEVGGKSVVLHMDFRLVIK
ncbi:MAG: hypothetical protein R2762_30695 [Bryobacteraceae bacterium]